MYIMVKNMALDAPSKIHKYILYGHIMGRMLIQNFSQILMFFNDPSMQLYS